MVTVFIVSHTIIIVTALWAIFSRRVNDGLAGRVVLALMCCTCLANIGWAAVDRSTVDRSDASFAVTVAVMAIRCYWIKYYAARVRRWARNLRKGA